MLFAGKSKSSQIINQSGQATEEKVYIGIVSESIKYLEKGKRKNTSPKE
ncbi:MAG: hypothetical protein JXM68_14450 [Sedimentisphaerales bacterium]|nr:hypothetical protein [Sedimentisphaerales bacterium]